jgi:hypothetical protein
MSPQISESRSWPSATEAAHPELHSEVVFEDPQCGARVLSQRHHETDEPRPEGRAMFTSSVLCHHLKLPPVKELALKIRSGIRIANPG